MAQQPVDATSLAVTYAVLLMIFISFAGLWLSLILISCFLSPRVTIAIWVVFGVLMALQHIVKCMRVMWDTLYRPTEASNT